MSSARSSSARIPSRTMSWSSTSITRVGRARARSVGPSPAITGLLSSVPEPLDGDRNPDRGALPRHADDLRPPTEPCRPRPEVRKTPAGTAAGRHVEAAAVIVDLQQRRGAPLVTVQRDPAGRRAGVAAHVGERLARQLDDLGRAGSQRRGGVGVDLGDRHHAAAVAELLHHLLQRRPELPVGQDPRLQPEDVVAQVTDDPVQLFHGRLDPLHRLPLADQRGGPLQAEPDGEQRLDGAVVQLPCDPLPVLQRLQPVDLTLKPGLLQHHRRLPGEHLRQPDLPLLERPAAASANTITRSLAIASPDTDPSSGNTPPTISSAPVPSAARTTSPTRSAVGTATLARSARSSDRAWRATSPITASESSPRRMAVPIACSASRRWTRSSSSWLRCACSSSASNSPAPCFSVR